MSNYHTRILCLLWVTMVVIMSSVQSKQSSKSQCGIRSWGAPLNNATQLSNFDEEYFRAFPDSFPWVF